MEKINWINGQSGGTPLSAENLNLMQDNAENAINEVATNIEQLKTDVENKHTYSTEEQVVGTWIDGKPLYRKVISSNFASTVNSQKAIGTIKDFNVIVKFEGYFTNPKNDNFYPFPFALNDEDISVYFYKSTGEIFEIHNYSYANNLYCYAVVEYTKTTD